MRDGAQTTGSAVVVGSRQAAAAMLSRWHPSAKIYWHQLRIPLTNVWESLAYLQRLPVNELKIDRSFVMRLTSDSDSAVIVRSTIELAHNLGLTVVAEGVEDQASMDLLVAYGCDSLQGYHLGRPSPIEDLNIWLTDSPYGLQVSSEHRLVDWVWWRPRRRVR